MLNGVVSSVMWALLGVFGGDAAAEDRRNVPCDSQLLFIVVILLIVRYYGGVQREAAALGDRGRLMIRLVQTSSDLLDPRFALRLRGHG